MESKITLIHWFRKGLRVHDNPALSQVFRQANLFPGKYQVRPVFIIDPDIIEWLNVGANRWRFLQQTLADLHEQLVQLNSRLYVVRGKTYEVFNRILKEWNVELLTFELDTEPYSKKRDAAVIKLARESGVFVETHSSHTIYNPEVVVKKNSGFAPLTYKKFLNFVKKLRIEKPIPKPEKLTIPVPPQQDEWEKKNANCYDFPLLDELVKHPEQLGANIFIGGETEGLKRLDAALNDDNWAITFEKPNTKPNLLEPITTVISPYLTVGCLSVRLFYKRLTICFERYPTHSKPPVSMIGQLMWREFYYTAASAEPNFNRMFGNNYCLQISWKRNDKYLDAWANARTGYPFIDAIMRQLRQEGWIHHSARYAVACFLTRSDLWISWEEGQKVFENLLLDHDWSLNAGNWLWLSASSYFHKYYSLYSPVAFGKKTDPTGKYIRKYVPELVNYPDDCINEPWKATLSAQREYGCVLGQDYPHRIVIHEIVHRENIKRMCESFKINQIVRNKRVEKREHEESAEEPAPKRSAADEKP